MCMSADEITQDNCSHAMHVFLFSLSLSHTQHAHLTPFLTFICLIFFCILHIYTYYLSHAGPRLKKLINLEETLNSVYQFTTLTKMPQQKNWTKLKTKSGVTLVKQTTKIVIMVNNVSVVFVKC